MCASFSQDLTAPDTQMRGQVTVDGWHWPDGFSFNMDDVGIWTVQLTREEDDATQLVQMQVRRSTTLSEFAIDITPVETGTEAERLMREPEVSVDARESQLLKAGLTKKQVQARLARQNPVWIDEDKKVCMLCDLRFTMLLRRHHCRVCGWVICSRCAPESCTVQTDRWCSSTEGHALMQLTDGSTKDKRCCKSCFDNAPREIKA
jgi:superfamily II helicase